MHDILLDACCLLNLYSTGRCSDILRVLGHRWHVCAAVVSEALYTEVVREGRREREKLDVAGCIAAGLFTACQPESDEEFAYYARYAAQLDDGEAMCLALAKCRSWTVATDERKGRRVAKNENIETTGTAAILKSWGNKAGVSRDALREVIQSVMVLGHFRPPKDDPEIGWWRRNAPSDGE